MNSLISLLFPLALLAVIVVGLFGFFALMMKKGPKAASSPKSKNDAPLAFVRRPSLITQNELAFFRVLQAVAEPHWRIFSKVRIEDIIEVPNHLEYRQRQQLRGRIKSRHVDFLLCDPQALEPLMCIELDDKSHARPKTKEADTFNDRAMEKAGLPLIRIPARQSYHADYVTPFIFETPARRDDARFAPTSSRAGK